MKLEDIKTENDARQALVERIIEIYHFRTSSAIYNRRLYIQELDRKVNFYKDIQDLAIKKYGIDTTPYDNVARGYVTNV